MYLTKEIKEEIFAQHGEKTNTGKQKVVYFQNYAPN
jgi:small subunit ribosomal protein S15